jgi:WD40 repeat protein
LRRFGPYAECVGRLAFSPDSKELALGDEHGTIRVCDVAGGKERCRCGLHAGNSVLALAFAPDGRTLAAGGTNEKAVRLFDTATGITRLCSRAWRGSRKACGNWWPCCATIRHRCFEGNVALSVNHFSKWSKSLH